MMSRPVAAGLSGASTPYVKALWRGFLEYGGRFVNETFRTLKLASLSQKQAAQEEMFAKIDDLRLRAALGGGPGFEGGGGKDPVLKKEVEELLRQVANVQNYLYRKKVLEKGKDDLGPHIAKIAAAESAAEADSAAAEIRAVIYRMYRRSERRSANVVLATTAVVLLLSGLYYRYNMKQQITNLRQEKAGLEEKYKNDIKKIAGMLNLNVSENITISEIETKLKEILADQQSLQEAQKSLQEKNLELKAGAERFRILQELINTNNTTLKQVLVYSFLDKLQKVKSSDIGSTSGFTVETKNRNLEDLKKYGYNDYSLTIIVKSYSDSNSPTSPVITYTFELDNKDNVTLKIEFAENFDLIRNGTSPFIINISSEKQRDPIIQNINNFILKAPISTRNGSKIYLDSEEWVSVDHLTSSNENDVFPHPPFAWQDEFYGINIRHFDKKELDRIATEVEAVAGNGNTIEEINFKSLHANVPELLDVWKELYGNKQSNKPNLTFGRNPLYYPYEHVPDEKYINTRYIDDGEHRPEKYLIKPNAPETKENPDAATTESVTSSADSKNTSPENKTDGVVKALESAWKKIKDVLISNDNIQLTHLDLSDSNIPENFFHEIVDKHKATLKVVKCDNVLRTVPLNLGSLPECPNLEVLHCNYYLYQKMFYTFDKYNTEFADTTKHAFKYQKIAQAAWKVFADAYNVSEKKQFQNLIELSMNIKNGWTEPRALEMLKIKSDAEPRLKNFNGHNVVVKLDTESQQNHYTIMPEAQNLSATGISAAKKVCGRCGFPKRAR